MGWENGDWRENLRLKSLVGSFQIQTSIPFFSLFVFLMKNVRVQPNESSDHANGQSVQPNQRSVHMIGRCVHVKESFRHVNQYSVHITQPLVHMNGRFVHDAEPQVHVNGRSVQPNCAHFQKKVWFHQPAELFCQLKKCFLQSNFQVIIPYQNHPCHLFLTFSG